MDNKAYTIKQILILKQTISLNDFATAKSITNLDEIFQLGSYMNIVLFVQKLIPDFEIIIMFSKK